MRALFPTLLLCSVPLAAQGHTSYPIDNPAANTSQNIPIAGGSIASWDEARSQFYFPAQYLPANPGLLNGIEWATHISGTIPYERFEINIGTATGPGLTSSYASNFANVMQVYSLSNGSITWGAGWAGVTFPVPYVYDGTSSLVVEVRKKIDRPNNPTIQQATQSLYAYPYRTDLPRPIWSWGAYGSGAVDGPSAQTTNNTLMITRMNWLGVPTLNIDSSRDVTGNTNRGYYHLGATVTNSVQGNPSDFFAIVLDLSILPAPTTVPLLGGELWVVPNFLLATGLLDGSGNGSSSFAIPSNPALVALHAYMQAASLGVAGGPLTNVVDMIVQPY